MVLVVSAVPSMSCLSDLVTRPSIKIPIRILPSDV